VAGRGEWIKSAIVVIPAKAGIHEHERSHSRRAEFMIPAFAGMKKIRPRILRRR
jgi:hypothetical protein